MKNLRNSVRRSSKLLVFCMTMILMIHCQQAHSESRTEPDPTPDKKQSIMLALLLDTSNSMDGLIEQAKSQLWKIVNELAAAKCDDGSRPEIRIALYEYGNDRLSQHEGYIRQVSPLTDDLDLISEKLFALTTNGGSEFCGHVIRTSVRELEWTISNADLKMIFIAGNEPFTQGSVPYQTACTLATEKGIVVNTIYCGSFDEGMNTSWKNGASLTGGSYMSINHNSKTVYIPTPYDDQIDALNEKLNNTYIYYGATGEYKKRNQATQDSNAESYGKANKVERAVSKSSGAYSNSSWDLVDAAKNDDKAIEKAPTETLPQEMRTMSVEQRKHYVQQKSDERIKIQAEIQKLNAQRKVYQEQHKPATNEASLDATMIKSIRTQAKEKNLSWQEGSSM